MKNRRKIIISIFLSIILSLTLTGCLPTIEDYKELAAYKKQGKINAKNYIKEKYGFDIKIINTTVSGRTDILSSDFTYGGEVYIKAKANNKTFHIYITGKTESTDGIDDYQTKEIEKDYINLLTNTLKIKPYNYKFEYNNSYPNYLTNTNLIHEYYDKNNLNEIIKNIKFLELYYINNIDLNSLDISTLSKEYNNAKLSIINFKTKNDYLQYKIEYKNDEDNCSSSCDNKFIIYKQNELILNNSNTEYYEYNKSHYNNEVYIYSFDKESIPITISNTNMDIEKIKESLYTSRKKDKYKNKTIKQITNTYSIPCEDTMFYIFFPIIKKNNTYSNLIQQIDEFELIFAYEYYRNDILTYDYEENIREFTANSYYYYDKKFIDCSKNQDIKFTLLRATKKD